MAIAGRSTDRLEAITRYGARGAAGAAGEARTAALLAERFADDPGTWVFHHCRAPGYRGADVDHVVVRGVGSEASVVLVDSKCWKPGRYWSLGGSLRRGLSSVPAAADVQLAEIVRNVRTGLPWATVHAVGVLWPSQPGRLGAGAAWWRARFPGGVPVYVGTELPAVLEQLLGPPSAAVTGSVLQYWRSRQ